MGNFSNYWDLYTLFTKIKNKIKSVSDSIPTKLSDLTADATHRTVTDTEKSTWNNKSNFSGSYNDLTNKPTIPTKTSQLTNNSNFVADSSYVHTDNNYTTAEKTKLSGIASGAEANVQSDWNQTTTTADDYIKNKPTSLPASDVSAWAKASTKPTYTASEVGAVATSSLPLSAANGGTGKTNLADSANALINSLSLGTSDPVDDDYYICQWANGGTSVTTYHRRPVSKLWNYIKSKLATVATSGSYNDLSNKPTIPTTASDVNAAPAADVPFKFGVDSSGNYGYIKAGADTVTPFKTVGTRASNITANGTYTASTDISKDGYSSVTVAVPNSVQTKTVTPGTSQMYVTPDEGYIGLSRVTINVANNQQKSVSPTVAAQIVRPDTGYWLNSVTVLGIPTQEKSVTPSASAQTVTPDSGKYLTSVSVGAIQTETKSVTPSSSAQTVTPSSGKYLTSVSVGAISTQTKSITATASTQTVTPDSGKYLSSVTVYPQQHTETIKVSANGTTSMGDTHNYKIVDSSGAYSAGYSARAPKVLWTNPSPGSNFAAKTITISGLKNYSYVFIIGRVTTTLSGYHSIMGGFEPNNIGTTWNVDSTYTGLTKANFMLVAHGTVSRMREGYYNGSTQITIGHAFNLGYNSSTGAILPISNDNSFNIPEKIIGIL